MIIYKYINMRGYKRVHDYLEALTLRNGEKVCRKNKRLNRGKPKKKKRKEENCIQTVSVCVYVCEWYDPIHMKLYI